MKAILLTTLALALAASARAQDGQDLQHARIGYAISARVAVPALFGLVTQRDPGDSLYRAAREALGDGDYGRAAQLFHDVALRFPRSALVPGAMYYEAFARYRSGRSGDLAAARSTLASLSTRFPDYSKRSDAATLSTRICGELAQRGDAACAATIATQAATNVQPSGSTRSTGAGPNCAREGDDERVAALNALLQMDASRAEPILTKVLARRDPCSAVLRRKAVFLIAQQSSPNSTDVLLRTAQTDPDAGVRQQSVFWLGQMPGERAVSVLDRILTTASDRDIREKAIFALSQNQSDAARQIIRNFAQNASEPSDLREKAIFWLGQAQGADNTAFLKSLFSRLTDPSIKEKTLFSLSQQRDPSNSAWLLQVAQDPRETIDMRQKALFMASQSGTSIGQLTRLYDALPAGEGKMREQMIFALSQRSEPAALDKLISIARSDKDPEARKKALFWLSQSHDPRVTQFLTEVIEK